MGDSNIPGSIPWQALVISNQEAFNGVSKMLVLSRKEAESIFVGHDVKITVISIQGNKVRIGIDAPKDMQVHREEVYLELYQKGA